MEYIFTKQKMTFLFHVQSTGQFLDGIFAPLCQSLRVEGLEIAAQAPLKHINKSLFCISCTHFAKWHQGQNL